MAEQDFMEDDIVVPQSLTTLQYELNDYPGALKSGLLGLQHVLVMFTAMIGMPLILANILDLPPDLTTAMILAVMLGCGVGTIVQALGIGFIGARLPIVMGVFYIFIGPIVSISATASLAAAMTAIFLGGLFEFLLSPVIGKIRRLFPPLVTGTVITLIGVCLMPIAARNAVGFNTPNFGDPLALTLAATTVALIVVINRITRGFMKAMSLFLALVAGYVLAVALGFVDFGAVRNADWVALPTLFPYGPPEFPPIAGLIVILVAFVASLVETVGDVLAVSEAVDVEPTEERIRGGVAVDGLGSSFSSLFGGTPLTSYSQNIGVISLTGVGSRFVVAIGGGILILMALIPKIGAVISVIPSPVLGGTLIVMFGMVAAVGINIVKRHINTRRDALIFSTSLGVALAITVAPDGTFAALPDALRIIISDGIVVGAILAIVLAQILPQESLEPTAAQD